MTFLSIISSYSDNKSQLTLYGKNLSLNLAVSNLFDQNYLDHSSVGDYSEVPGYGLVVGPSEPGRDIRLSASLSF